MKTYFADTSYFLALVNDRDKRHADAKRIAAGIRGKLVTTHWVLAEIGNSMTDPEDRERAAHLIDSLQKHPNSTVLPLDQSLFDDGLGLFKSMQDKSWSLTDCISFTAMRRIKTLHALGFDHHFVQAGFVLNQIDP